MNKILTGFYPGWWVHAGLFSCALVIVGCSTYTFGLFVLPVNQELGLSRADINNAFITFPLGVGIISPLVGRLLDKVDLRYVYYAVALAHIALLVVYMLEPSYWVLLFFATLFGVAIGGVFPVWSTLLAWLFGAKNYGTVMGLMTIILKGFQLFPSVLSARCMTPPAAIMQRLWCLWRP